MKILFLSNQFYPYIGGIEVNSEVLADEFHKAGHNVRLLTWTKEEGDKVFPYPVVRQPNLATLFREHRWADIVYENNICLRLAWPAVFFSSKSVIALRTWVNRKQDGAGLADKMKWAWLKRASAVIAISEAVRAQCWPEAVVIGNPYRDQLFRIKSGIVRNKEFVFLGRLVSDKGADVAITAISILRKQGELSPSLTIVGDGPDKELLEKQVNDGQLQNNVSFAGSLRGESLVTALNQHQYLLVPSQWEEPFGNVALEGIACGCIPIVSGGGGLPDAIGNAGLIFKRGDVNDLVDCIKKVTEDSELRRSLEMNAKPHLANHKPDVVARRYLAVIENTIN